MTKAPQAKTAETKDATQQLDAARKIWLAGVGAYGRMYDDAQGRINKFTGEAATTFEELVKRGAQVEDEVKASLEKATARHAEQAAAFDKRVAEVRKTVTEAVSASAGLFTMGQTVTRLSEQVEALTAQIAALQAKSAPSAKPSAKAN